MNITQDNLFAPPTQLDQFFNSSLTFLTGRVFPFLKSLTPVPWPLDAPIEVVCISDTHNHRHDPAKFPKGHVLIHAGDLTNTGTVAEIQAQIDWLDTLDFQIKIVIAGNHDSWLDPETHAAAGFTGDEGPLRWKSLNYLRGGSAHEFHVAVFNRATSQVERRAFVVYGAPWVPKCGGKDFAFQYPRHIDKWWEKTFKDCSLQCFVTSILVTHTPPRYYHDTSSNTSLGCAHLLRELWRIKPTLHVFGHVHSSSGMTTLHWDAAQEAYESACASKAPTGQGGMMQVQATGLMTCRPIRAWLDLFTVLFSGLWSSLKAFFWPWLQRQESTVLLRVETLMFYTGFGYLSFWMFFGWSLFRAFIAASWEVYARFGLLFLVEWLEPARKETILVNAAMWYDDKGEPKTRPRVVAI